MKYVIDFYNHVDDLVIDQYLVDNNITKIKQLESFGKVYLVETVTPLVENELIEKFILDTEQGIQLLSFSIDLVDNYTETTFDIEDNKNWWKVATINKIDFDQPTHTHKIRGMNSTVYIIDSGITIDHTEFVGANIELLHSFNGNFIDNNGHGTGLSSLIVGPTCGLANPRLKVVKLFDNTQPTLQSDMLIALDTVLNDFINGGKKASIVNMSWLIPKNDYINAKIQYMIDQGMYVVAAAGNSGIAITDVTPASIPDVLTIGSFNQNLEPSSFSNYTGGSDISYTTNDVNYGALDGWAPGELIWAANKNGGYGYIAGTSASAAIASAAIAYNLNNFLEENGEINHTIPKNNNTQYINRLGAIREGLLDLSNKYSSSVNKIIQVISSPKVLPFMLSMQYSRAGELTYSRLFYPDVISSVSCNNLPEFITVHQTGLIAISYPEIENPFEKIDAIEFDVTFTDGSSGKHILNIIVWKQDYSNLEDAKNDNYLLLKEDPELAVVLAYGPGSCTTLGSEFECAEDGCSAFSGGSVTCNGGTKGNPCNCI